jgi:hypothetical protein
MRCFGPTDVQSWTETPCDIMSVKAANISAEFSTSQDLHMNRILPVMIVALVTAGAEPRLALR